MSEYPLHPVIADALWYSGQFPEHKNLYEFFKSGFCLTSDDRWKKFELEFSPWYSVLCEWFEDPTVDWIYLVQGSQTSKTTFMMGALLYVSICARGAAPALWVQSTEEEAKLFVTERLKHVLEGATRDVIRNWKQEFFRVGNCSVKVGYSTAIQSLRTTPARFIFGDECGIWKTPISYVKKRTRMFSGKRKGIFGTTPPFNGNHFSWRDATAANFYQWWVPCPKCGEYQALKFANLIFDSAKVDGEWDYDLVREVVRYRCEHCGDLWENSQKLELINKGKAVCVNPEDYKPIKEKKCDSRTLQITGLYSVATHWGQLACDFLTSKAGGIDSLKVFFTDELAEVPKEFGDKVSAFSLVKYVDYQRKPGYVPGYSLYTSGIDVQRNGDLYVVIMGWNPGLTPSGHVLNYFVCSWQGPHNEPNWDELLAFMEPYRKHLHLAALDATDGVVSQLIYDFCTSQGKPFIALRDNTVSVKKIEYKQIKNAPDRRRLHFGHKYMAINSDMVKDEISMALSLRPGDDMAWSFHSDTEEEFFKHLNNEHRVTERTKAGRERSTWKPRYDRAPQHFFSALVYAVACMDDKRIRLQRAGKQMKTIPTTKPKPNYSAIGNIYGQQQQSGVNPYSGSGIF